MNRTESFQVIFREMQESILNTAMNSATGLPQVNTNTSFPLSSLVTFYQGEANAVLGSNVDLGLILQIKMKQVTPIYLYIFWGFLITKKWKNMYVL